MNQFNNIIWNFNPFKDFSISHILTELFQDIVLSSYHVCLIAGVIGLVLYIFGCKKGKEVAMISPTIYLIIRILGSVILGVH